MSVISDVVVSLILRISPWEEVGLAVHSQLSSPTYHPRQST
jgi:hypothetical protein